MNNLCVFGHYYIGGAIMKYITICLMALCLLGCGKVAKEVEIQTDYVYIQPSTPAPVSTLNYTDDGVSITINNVNDEAVFITRIKYTGFQSSYRDGSWLISNQLGEPGEYIEIYNKNNSQDFIIKTKDGEISCTDHSDRFRIAIGNYQNIWTTGHWVQAMEVTTSQLSKVSGNYIELIVNGTVTQRLNMDDF
jgi:hypothetical protein